MSDVMIDAVVALIAAMGTGSVWALIGWGNAWIGDEKFTPKKILRVELIAIGAVVVSIALHITPADGLMFFMVNGGIPGVDKVVSFITKWINYQEPAAAVPPPPTA